jgi:hypothetical protein
VEPARSIGRLGFKRWYERQLMESHAWLVTCILCLVAIAASLEAISFKESFFGGVVTLVFVYVAGLIGWHALQRYGAIMREAERLAEHSTCAACRTYAAFGVTDEYPRMSVRCRKCGHEWTLN